MNTLLLLLLVVIFILPSGYLVYKLSGGLYLNYISLWFLTYLLFSLFGSLLISSGLANDSYFVRPFVNKSDIIFYGGTITIYVGFIVFFPLCLLLKKIGVNRNIIGFTNNDIIVRPHEKLALLVLCVIFIMSFFYYIYATNPNPLIMALKGYSPLDIAIRRLDLTKDLSLYANTYIIAIGKILAYLLSYSFVVISVKDKKNRFLTLVIIIISLLFFLSSGEKAPVLWYGIGLALAYNIAKGVKFKISLKLFVCLFVLVFCIYLLFVPGKLYDIVKLIQDRIIIAQQIAIYGSLDHYHDLFGNIGFHSLSNIVTKLFNVNLVLPASSVLMGIYYPGMLENGGWNVNGMFIYEAWSNFGIIGLLLGPIWVMLLSFIFLIIVFKLPKTPFNIAIYTYGTINITYFLTSFNAYIYNSDWIVFSLIYVIYYILSNVFNFKYANE
ncbi:O-antigen polymerase [Photobacterium carnosum]|uniref:O-antigen polymerase n=1 Tax=Photobacterium carnosum TaxID=2023717 RepID=UPI002430486C|nr:O-antigen ligase [Photobacterium carnosum]